MSDTNGNRIRISRIKPKQNTVMTTKTQRSAIFELMGVEENQSEASMLSSSKSLLKAVESLTEKRKDMGKVEWVTHDKLFKNLERCADLEEQLKQFGLKGSYSPSLFLSKIQRGTDNDLKHEVLLKCEKTAKQNLEDFIRNANSDKSISGELIAKFKSEIQKLISLQENYYYLEATKGFFCFEVISAYHSSLVDAVEALSKQGKSVH